MLADLFNFLIIRYGEIGLKSTKVRRQLEDLLSNRIIQMMDRKNIHHQKLKILPTRGRLFLYTDNLISAIDELKRCFGIVSLSPAFQAAADRKAICEASLKLAELELTKNSTFAIQTKRVGQHSFSSQEISAEVGAFILNNLADRNISVDLTNPNHTFYIEIRDKDAFLFNQIYNGPAGLPYGSQGKVISLVSGGIDSPIATWLMMKRGCEIIPLYCDLTPYSTSATYDRLIQVLQKLYEFSPHKQIILYKAPHGQMLKQVKELIPPKLTCLFCKRLMYKLAEMLAQSLTAKGIITGENLGQVASQTLDNLALLNYSMTIPLFRPLIGFDKVEIVNLSKTLGIYSKSIIQVPSCGAVPEFPETHGSLEAILEIEKQTNFNELVSEGFQKLEKIKVSLS